MPAMAVTPPHAMPAMTVAPSATMQVDPERLEAAHHMLAPLCLRRLKSEVELGMPPLVETRICERMESCQCRVAVHACAWQRHCIGLGGMPCRTCAAAHAG